MVCMLDAVRNVTTTAEKVYFLPANAESAKQRRFPTCRWHTYVWYQAWHRRTTISD